ncbi:hypothetical protein GN109_04685 [Collimonas pratensis]|uniref:SMI1/KNR4 family protein n=1 Tax=Collimonas pratensis TaxID=279113 RepID=UPI00143CDCDB|nr:SMI1/KNR4 family protein [Collimonas pratensis]NKI68709.1 hypothetical protein [Collimonas pratensis]
MTTKSDQEVSIADVKLFREATGCPLSECVAFMSKYAEAITNWRLPIPDEAEKFLSIEPNKCVATSGQVLALPWPPLTPSEIANSASVATDWGLHQGLVPVMGDFHNLVCLSFVTEGAPSVVIINDERIELACFSSISEFLNGIKPYDSAPELVKGIVKDKSWLNF